MLDWSKPESMKEDAAAAGGDQPTQIVFPGFDGIPYRGRGVPNLRNDDIKQPEEVWDGRAKVFDFSKEEDVIDYNRIVDNVAKGIYILCVEHHHWSPKTDNIKIYARWAERFAEPPNARYERVQVNGNQISFRPR
jgi:hypothetical protein